MKRAFTCPRLFARRERQTALIAKGTCFLGLLATSAGLALIWLFAYAFQTG